MGRLPRIYEANRVYESTTRAMQGRFLLLPGDEANDLIAGIYGRAQALFPEVRLYALVVLANHLTSLLSSPNPQDVPAFLGYVNGRISIELGALYDWPGKHFERSQRPIPIEDEAALHERFAYVLAQGVKEHLVERAVDWPGVSCVRSLVDGVPLEGTWYHRDRQTRALRRKNPPGPEAYATRYQVRFSRLPGMECLSDAEYAAHVAGIVEGIERQAAAERAERGTSVLGPGAILAQHPHDRPQDIARSPAPACHASSKSVRRRFRERLAALVAWFRDSADKLQQGVVDVVFPPGCFPPSFPHVTPANAQAPPFTAASTLAA